MAAVLLHNQMRFDTLTLPCAFVDDYLPAASGTDVKVYLYLLRIASDPDASLELSAVADALELTLKELMRSLNYWAGAGLIGLSVQPDHTLSGITFRDIRTAFADSGPSVSVPQAAHAKTGPASCGEPTAEALPAQQTEDKPQPKPAAGGPDCEPAADFSVQKQADDGEIGYHLTQEEQARLDNDQDFTIYMAGWQQYFPHPFTYTDTERISYWYLQFNRSPEIMDYLIEYCANHGHPNTGYMNCVALEWHRRGYRSLDELRRYNKIHNDTARAVMKTLGLYDQAPAPAQYEYIDKWLNEYGFSQELIVLACTRTIEKLQRPSMQYADGILRKWKEKNIRTPEDVASEDELHSSRSRQAAKAPASSPAKSIQSYHNFKERTDNNYTDRIMQRYSQKEA